MESEPLIIGFLFIALGGFYAARPDLVLRFHTWAQRVIMGAKYKPGKRTLAIVRLTGALFIILGLTAITGILKGA